MSLRVDARSSSARPDDTADDVATTSFHGLTYRALTSHEDAAACVTLQGDIWGKGFDQVPASLIHVATSIGGLAIGAFDDAGTLVGFVFSLAGVRDGHPIHWSHMLGVREDARDAGVGRHLKEMQRAELARRGVERVLWTFDPLQARNAHLNLNRLGVKIVDYVENMYGITQSPLHHGLATDRLIVMLPTSPNGEPSAAIPALSLNGKTPMLTPFLRSGDVTVDLADSAVESVLIEIPLDLQHVIAETPDVAMTWRMATRASFNHALALGYTVTGLRRDLTTNRAFYTLVAPTN